MRKSGEVYRAVSIFVAAALVVAMDAVIMPILLGYLYHTTSTTMVFVIDFSVVLLTGLAGLFFAPRVRYPIWWRQSNRSSGSPRATYLILLLGLILVALNTSNNIVNIEQAKQIAPWLALLTPETAIALAVRAALNEEIVFRLFLFPSAA